MAYYEPLAVVIAIEFKDYSVLYRVRIIRQSMHAALNRAFRNARKQYADNVECARISSVATFIARGGF